MSKFKKNSGFSDESRVEYDPFTRQLRIGKVEQLNDDPGPILPPNVSVSSRQQEIKEAASPDIEQWNYLLNEALGHFASGSQDEGVRIVEQVRDEMYRMLS